MKFRIIHFFGAASLVVAGLANSSLAQRSSPIRLLRADFINELFTPGPTARTIWYTAAISGSYLPNKSDLMDSIPEGAKARGLNLRALLVVGPSQSLDVYYVYAFVDEGRGVRVYQQTFAQKQIAYKSTRLLTAAEFQSFINKLLSANVLDSGQAPWNSEAKYELMLVRWLPNKVDSYYGTYLTQNPKAKVRDFGVAVGDLLRSLMKTYPNLTHPTEPVTPKKP